MAGLVGLSANIIRSDPILASTRRSKCLATPPSFPRFHLAHLAPETSADSWGNTCFRNRSTIARKLCHVRYLKGRCNGPD